MHAGQPPATLRPTQQTSSSVCSATCTLLRWRVCSRRACRHPSKLPVIGACFARLCSQPACPDKVPRLGFGTVVSSHTLHERGTTQHPPPSCAKRMPQARVDIPVVARCALQGGATPEAAMLLAGSRTGKRRARALVTSHTVPALQAGPAMGAAVADEMAGGGAGQVGQRTHSAFPRVPNSASER